MSNPYYSLTVAEVLDSPLGYLALMAVPVGLYFMFKILLWDYSVSQIFAVPKPSADLLYGFWSISHSCVMIFALPVPARRQMS